MESDCRSNRTDRLSTPLRPSLEKGQVIPAGTEVLKIDPLDYELKLVQAEADLKSSQTSLEKLNQEEENLKQTLKIEKNRLVISQ